MTFSGPNSPDCIDRLEGEKYRRADSGHVGFGWDERARTTATGAGAGQKYQVPLSEYLRRDESDASLAVQKERKEDDARRNETR